MVSLLVLIFGLLGLSTQVLARTACVELDDGGRWCWEYEEYNVSLSPDDFNQGYYVPPDGNPVGGDGSVQHDFIEVLASKKGRMKKIIRIAMQIAVPMYRAERTMHGPTYEVRLFPLV